MAKEIFNHDEIKQINNQWTDNPFNQGQLDKFFDVPTIAKRAKNVKTFLIDVNEKADGLSVCAHMSDQLQKLEKERLKQEKKKAKGADKDKKEKKSVKIEE